MLSLVVFHRNNILGIQLVCKTSFSLPPSLSNAFTLSEFCVSAEASAEQLDFVLQMVENDKDFYIR